MIRRKYKPQREKILEKSFANEVTEEYKAKVEKEKEWFEYYE